MNESVKNPHGGLAFSEFVQQLVMAKLSLNIKSSMETEIYEQPEILARILESYLILGKQVNIDVPEDTEKIVLVASGSSYHCARYAADLFGQISDIEARAMYSSEFLLKPLVPHDKGTLYIFITQSGETSDTLRASKKAKQLGITTMCITNKEDSSIWNISDYKINCHAGEEKSIAATKSLTAQMLCLYLVALKYAQIKNLDVSEHVAQLKNLPKIIEKTFAEHKKIKQLARFLSKYQNLIITADGISYALAKEASLKIKETSYLNVNANILGEFMHGHVAVLNNKSALVYISREVSYSAAKNLEQIKKDYNPPICIIGKSSTRLEANFNINVECEDDAIKMFSNAVIIQLLALEIAQKLGRNVDKPKGLHKVVLEN